MVYYNGLLYVTNADIDPNTHTILRKIASPDPENSVYVFTIHGEHLYAAVGSTLYCMSLVFLEGNKEYLESIAVWDKFVYLVDNQTQEVANYRDERDNGFLTYCVHFATKKQLGYMFEKHPEHFDLWKGNKHGESGYTMMLKLQKEGDLSRINLPQSSDDDNVRVAIMEEQMLVNISETLLEFVATIPTYAMCNLAEFIKKRSFLDIVFRFLKGCLNTWAIDTLKDDSLLALLGTVNVTDKFGNVCTLCFFLSLIFNRVYCIGHVKRELPILSIKYLKMMTPLLHILISKEILLFI